MPAAPPRPAAPRGKERAITDPEDLDDDDERGRHTSVMSAIELDNAIPNRAGEVVPGHLAKKPPMTIESDPLDDGWGPPGTTIPPPLLGAVPGTGDDADSAMKCGM